jgi:hypothetical protein
MGSSLRHSASDGDCSGWNRLASQNVRGSFPKLLTPGGLDGRKVGFACSLRTAATSSGAGIDGRARDILAY